MYFLAAYKDLKTGEVKRAHTLKDVTGRHEIAKSVKEYNNRADRKDDVEVIEIENGSLQDFLYKRADVAVCDFKERLQDIESSIDSLSSDIRDLLREAERQRPNVTNV